MSSSLPTEAKISPSEFKEMVNKNLNYILEKEVIKPRQSAAFYGFIASIKAITQKDTKQFPKAYFLQELVIERAAIHDDRMKYIEKIKKKPLYVLESETVRDDISKKDNILNRKAAILEIKNTKLEKEYNKLKEAEQDKIGSIQKIKNFSAGLEFKFGQLSNLKEPELQKKDFSTHMKARRKEIVSIIFTAIKDVSYEKDANYKELIQEYVKNNLSGEKEKLLVASDITDKIEKSASAITNVKFKHLPGEKQKKIIDNFMTTIKNSKELCNTLGIDYGEISSKCNIAKNATEIMKENFIKNIADSLLKKYIEKHDDPVILDMEKFKKECKELGIKPAEALSQASKISVTLPLMKEHDEVLKRLSSPRFIGSSSYQEETRKMITKFESKCKNKGIDCSALVMGAQAATATIETNLGAQVQKPAAKLPSILSWFQEKRATVSAKKEITQKAEVANQDSLRKK